MKTRKEKVNTSKDDEEKVNMSDNNEKKDEFK